MLAEVPCPERRGTYRSDARRRSEVLSPPKQVNHAIYNITLPAHLIVLHIPSVGLETGARPEKPPSTYDDAAFIAAYVTSLADAGRYVLLVAHFYGGTSATESVRGLNRKERLLQGETGGIVGLAHVTGLVPEVRRPAQPRQKPRHRGGSL
ncbi:hypothetical protein F5Y19DRAFT_479746 [Xylariaceae sp. FL1651]|nr:hypothetical protein F5Y19DRAFT_479746 [Xylariaceae sp. FL1651]